MASKEVTKSKKLSFSTIAFGFIVGILVTLFAAEDARAILIESARFNSAIDKIEMKVVYDGGFKDHSFTLQWDSCSKATPNLVAEGFLNQVAARLVDTTGFDDTGTQIFHTDLEFELDDPACRSALLTIISGLHSRVSVRIP
jgi:hypothetical protein